tara:strand:+ start:731 stop:1024 length:294 start_codon:yes stop_codon:yes gene_type:complete
MFAEQKRKRLPKDGWAMVHLSKLQKGDLIHVDGFECKLNQIDTVNIEVSELSTEYFIVSLRSTEHPLDVVNVYYAKDDLIPRKIKKGLTDRLVSLFM